MTPLIFGNPLGGGMRVLESLATASATIAWSDHGALTDSVTDVLWHDGNTLFVDTAVGGGGNAAIAHQLQVMGVPQFVVVIVDDPSDLAPATELTRIALTAIPPSAVLVIGDAKTQQAIRDVATELELVPPLPTTIDDLPAVASELLATARWESVS